MLAISGISDKVTCGIRDASPHNRPTEFQAVNMEFLASQLTSRATVGIVKYPIVDWYQICRIRKVMLPAVGGPHGREFSAKIWTTRFCKGFGFILIDVRSPLSERGFIEYWRCGNGG